MTKRYDSPTTRIPISALPLIAAAALLAPAAAGTTSHAQIDGGSLDPASIEKYVDPLVNPPAMPRTKKINQKGAKNVDYYEIAVRQFDQMILPTSATGCAGGPCSATTVWSYGSLSAPGTVAQGGTFNYPALTIEAKWRAPVRIKWVNQLVSNPDRCGTRAAQPGDCDFLPHLLPVDQTLHWANPPQTCKDGTTRTDCRGTDPVPYAGPGPMVVHVHGAETTEDSDGYPEAWWLPAAGNIPAGYASGGSFYGTFKGSSPIGADWGPGSAVFQYPNDQEAATLWYHDHTLGMTRQNVYAGPAGFYILRGGPGDMVLDSMTNLPAELPRPAPALGDPPGLDYYEIPLAIQDRSFNADGSLFYPDNRAFFEGLSPEQLQIPFIPQAALGGMPSDVSPIWNPEFFGNTIVVNGRTWPYLDVEPRRYRLRYLNGCDSRFLILRLVAATDPDDPTTWTPVAGAFWQIGAEQGFLPAPVQLDELLMAPAERADVIMDFSSIAVPHGAGLYLVNVGPDEPFGGGVPGIDFDPADPGSTGQVMEFRPVPLKSPDTTTPPARLLLPAPPVLDNPVATRRISLNEEDSKSVFVVEETDGEGNVIRVYEVPEGTPDAFPFGPTEALLGTVNADGTGVPLLWADPTSENVASPGDTEVWEIYNYTMDAHPIHIHLVQFQVVDRQELATDDMGMTIAVPVGEPRPPEDWETGFKDTVIAYPGEVTRVKAMFPLAGLFVWHCHILEHEDNEMMRPYCVGNTAACMQHNDQGHGGH